jgi:hypothetical protein
MIQVVQRLIEDTNACSIQKNRKNRHDSMIETNRRAYLPKPKAMPEGFSPANAGVIPEL